jgi:hypothetical protein
MEDPGRQKTIGVQDVVGYINLNWNPISQHNFWLEIHNLELGKTSSNPSLLKISRGLDLMSGSSSILFNILAMYKRFGIPTNYLTYT